jgi:hypothetical protein
VGLASFLLAVAGLVLGATVDMAWLILFALGVFGPALLRETGLLRDRDEFQREAALRAGYRAYLAGGLFLAVVVIARSWGVRNLDHDQFSASTALVVLLLVYLLSHLTSFWGARKAAFRVLLVFGLFWLAFVVLSHRGIEMLMEALVPLPMIVLALTSLRWPRVSGAILVALAIYGFFFLNLQRAFEGNPGALMVILLLLMPLLFSGIALLGAKDQD